MCRRPGRRSAPTARAPLAVSLAAHGLVLALCLLALPKDPAAPEPASQPLVTMVFEPAPAEPHAAAASPDPAPTVELPPPEPPPPVDVVPPPRQEPPSDAAPPDPEPLALPPPVLPPAPPERPAPPVRSTPPRTAPTRAASPRPAASRPAPPRAAATTPFAGPATPGVALPGPAAPPAPPVDAAPDPSWQQALGAWLAAHKVYPEEARRRGEDGRVVVRFTVDRSGHVLDVELIHSSGSSRLDDATETMLRSRQVPPFVAGMTQDRVTVTVTIRYALSP